MKLYTGELNYTSCKSLRAWQQLHQRVTLNLLNNTTKRG